MKIPIYFKIELVYKIPQYKINIQEIDAVVFQQYFKNYNIELNNIIQESEYKTFVLIKFEEEKLEVDLLKPISTILLLKHEKENAKNRNEIICDAMQKLIDDMIVLLNMKIAKLNNLRLEIETKYKNKKD